MKHFYLIILFIAVSTTLIAQAPDAFKYQAVVRGSDGNLITEQAVSFQIDILQGSTEGMSVYTETHSVNTNEYGLANLEIGIGTTTDDFSAIKWADDKYFIQISLDATGGTSYELMGTSQLLSVPYALHTRTADSAFNIAETLNLTKILSEGNLADDVQIKEVADPTDPQDVVTLAYLESVLRAHGIIVDSVTFLYNGKDVTYGVVEFNGKKWLDRNLGASRVATSIDDTEAYGDLFQWGREADGHQLRSSSLTSTLAPAGEQPNHGNFISNYSAPYDWNIDASWITRWTDELGMKTSVDVCPDGWRVPTKEEWANSIDGWTDFTDAFNSPLKLPSGGVRYYSGVVDLVDITGCYTSSSIHDSAYDKCTFLNFSENTCGLFFNNRAQGLSVRCIKE